MLVLLTGLARIWWGMKGGGWYWSNWLLHLKLALFVVVVAVLAIKPAQMFRRWRRELQATGALPDEAQIRQARRAGDGGGAPDRASSRWPRCSWRAASAPRG